MRWSTGDAMPARQACMAVLAEQGLRPTTAGGHYAIEETIRAQFGPVLRAFGGLRHRRNELEYTLYPTEQASTEEASEMLNTAADIIEAVAKFLQSLGFSDVIGWVSVCPWFDDRR